MLFKIERLLITLQYSLPYSEKLELSTKAE